MPALTPQETKDCFVELFGSSIEDVVTYCITVGKDDPAGSALVTAIQQCIVDTIDPETLKETILACITKEVLADIIQGNINVGTVDGIETTKFIEDFKFGFNFGEPGATGLIGSISPAAVIPTAAEIATAFNTAAVAQGIVITLAANTAGDAVIATAGNLSDIADIELDPGAVAGVPSCPVTQVTA